MKIYKNQYIYLVTSVLLMMIFLWLFLKSAQWSEVFSIIKQSRILWLFMALLALLADFAIRLLRWKYILRRHNPMITLRQCFTPYFSSFALNNLLPFRLGDVARATLFNQQLGVGVHPIVSSLMIERITDLLSLLMLFFGCLLFLSVDTNSHPIFLYIFLVSALAVLLVIGLLGFPDKIIHLLKQSRLYMASKNIPLAEVTLGFMQKIAESFSMHIAPRTFSVLLLAALGAWIFEAITFAWVAYSMNIKLAVDEGFFVMSMATLSTLLPSTPGYVGTFDYLCKLSLNLIGVDEIHAVAATILMHIVNLAPITLIGGFAFIFYFGADWLKKIRNQL